MTTQNKESHPFWSGFAVGTLVGTGLMYLIGTKNGRETTHRILENTENFEESVQKIFDYLQKNDIFTDTSDKQSTSGGIGSVIDKVSSFVQETTEQKKPSSPKGTK